MPLTRTRTITDSRVTAVIKVPIKYFTQSGVVVEGGGSSGGESGSSGDGGPSGGGVGSPGDVGCCSVVKAPTALQAL